MKKLFLAAIGLIGCSVSAMGQNTFPFSDYFIDSPIRSFDELQSGIYIIQGYAKDSGNTPHEGIFRSTTSDTQNAATYDSSMKSLPTTLDDEAILWEITVTPATENTPKTFTVKSVKEGYYWSFCGTTLRNINGDAYVNGDMTKTSGTYSGTNYNNLVSGDNNIADFTFANNAWNHTLPNVAPTLDGPRFVVTSTSKLLHANNRGVATDPGIPTINLTGNNNNLNWWNISQNDTGTGGTQAWLQFLPVKPYPPYQTPALNANIPKNTDGGRFTGNIVISYTDYMGQDETIIINDLQTSTTDGHGYYDKSNVVFTIAPGSKFSLSNTIGYGPAGMQKCLYIDWDNNFQFGPNNADNYVQTNYVVSENTATAEHPKGTILTNELVFYHALKQNSTWYNESGNVTNQSAGYNLQIRDIKVPTDAPDGDYRVRYKYSWNDINPYTPANSGGIVVDFTLRVRRHAEPIEYTINCGGVTISALGVPGDPISINEIHGIPDYFIPSEDAVLITPAAGETLILPGKWEFPFNFDTPYLLTLRQSSGNPSPANGPYSHLYYADPYLKNRNVAPAHLTLNPYLLWYVKDAGIVDNVKVVTLHNLSTDETLGVYAGNNGDSCVIREDMTKFAIHKNADGFGLRIVSMPNGYINDCDGYGRMSVWDNKDGKTAISGRMWLEPLTDSDFNVQSWIAHDGFTYYLDSEKIEAARTKPTIENLRSLFAYEPMEKITREYVITAISHETAYNDLVNRLVNSTLYNAKDASTAIFNALAIPEESDDFASVLEKCKVSVGNISAADIITKYLDGKKVAFRNNSGNGRFKKGDTSNMIVNSRNNNTLTIDAVWLISANAETNTFTMQNMVDGKYAKGLEVTPNIEDAVPYRLANEQHFPGAFALKATTVNGTNFLNDNTNNGHLQYKEAGASNNSSFWFIDLVTEETEKGFIDAIETHIPALSEGMVIGDEPGKYSVPENYTEIRTRIETLSESFDYAEAENLLNSPSISPTLFDIHSIESTALIRIKDINGHYMTNEGGFAAKTTPNDDTVFVIENDEDGNAAVSSLNGHYLTVPVSGNMAHLRIFPGETIEGIEHNTPTVINFLNNYGIIGGYAIGFHNGGQSNGQDKGILTSVNDTFDQYSGVEYRMDIDDNRIHFFIEYVKNLTVEVEDGDYKLWRTPVAINFDGNDESGAYVVSVNGTRITTTPVDGTDTYGAGTIFILTQTVNLSVENGHNVATESAGLGYHAKKMHTMTAGKVYLSIHIDNTPEVAPAAEQNNYTMYFEAPNAANTIKMDVDIPTENTSKYLGAHEALIEATNSTEYPLQHGTTMELSLGGSSDTTQIAEISAEGNADGAVYDLQGRKLVAPIKGINIVNGKKILVK